MTTKVKYFKRGTVIILNQPLDQFFDPNDTFFGFILSEKNLNNFFHTE